MENNLLLALKNSNDEDEKYRLSGELLDIVTQDKIRQDLVQMMIYNLNLFQFKGEGMKIAFIIGGQSLIDKNLTSGDILTSKVISLAKELAKRNIEVVIFCNVVKPNVNVRTCKRSNPRIANINSYYFVEYNYFNKVITCNYDITHYARLRCEDIYYLTLNDFPNLELDNVIVSYITLNEEFVKEDVDKYLDMKIFNQDYLKHKNKSIVLILEDKYMGKMTSKDFEIIYYDQEKHNLDQILIEAFGVVYDGQKENIKFKCEQYCVFHQYKDDIDDYGLLGCLEFFSNSVLDESKLNTIEKVVDKFLLILED